MSPGRGSVAGPEGLSFPQFSRGYSAPPACAERLGAGLQRQTRSLVDGQRSIAKRSCCSALGCRTIAEENGRKGAAGANRSVSRSIEAKYPQGHSKCSGAGKRTPRERCAIQEATELMAQIGDVAVCVGRPFPRPLKGGPELTVRGIGGGLQPRKIGRNRSLHA